MEIKFINRRKFLNKYFFSVLVQPIEIARKFIHLSIIYPFKHVEDFYGIMTVKTYTM